MKPFIYVGKKGLG